MGARIVLKEGELDRQFATRKISESELVAETLEIGTDFGRLRAVHLRAHLETAAMLDAVQIARYNELRGYGPSAVPQSHDPQKAHGG